MISFQGKKVSRQKERVSRQSMMRRSELIFLEHHPIPQESSSTFREETCHRNLDAGSHRNFGKSPDEVWRIGIQDASPDEADDEVVVYWLAG